MVRDRRRSATDLPAPDAGAGDDADWFAEVLLGEEPVSARATESEPAEPPPEPRFPTRFLDALDEACVVVVGDRFVYANDAFLQLTGYAYDEILGLGATADLLPLDARRRDAAPFACSGAATTTLITSGDRRLDVEITCEALGSGEETLAVVRRARESAPGPGASASVQRVLDASPEPMAVLAHDGRIIQVNEAFRSALGGAASNWRDARLTRVVHRDDVRAVRSAIDAALAGADLPAAVARAFRVRRHDGSWARVTSRVRRVAGAHGETPAVILGLRLDDASASASPAAPLDHAAHDGAPDDLARLFLDASAMLHGGAGLDEMLEALAHLAGEHLAADRAVVVQKRGGDRSRLVARGLWHRNPGPRAHASALRADPEAAAWIANLSRTGGAAGHVTAQPPVLRTAATAAGIRTFAAAPIVVDGQVWGYIEVDDCSLARDWDAPSRETVVALGRAAAVAIQREDVDGAMRAGLEHYRRLVEEAHDIIYSTDLEGRFIWANRATERLTGYDVVALRDMYLSQLITPDSEQAVREALAPLLAGEQSSARCDIEGVAADGSRFALDLSLRVSHEAGAEPHVHGIGRDVTARRQAEDLFKVVANSSQIGIYVAAHGRFQFVNPEFAATTGYSPADLIGRQTVELVAPDHRDRVRKTAVSRLKSGRTQPYEYQYVHSSGELRWVMETVTSIRYNGEPAALGNFIDITERKQAEERLSRQAFEDELTGLPNRASFLERLEAVIAAPAPEQAPLVAVLFVDLDWLKDVNDRLGHEAGDEVLALAGARIAACLPGEGDQAARLGGDEFTLVLTGLATPEQAEAVARDIVSAVAEPFAVQGEDVRLSASVGVAYSRPGSTTGRDLMRSADAALYSAKAAGKNRYVVAIPEAQDRVA